MRNIALGGQGDQIIRPVIITPGIPSRIWIIPPRDAPNAVREISREDYSGTIIIYRQDRTRRR